MKARFSFALIILVVSMLLGSPDTPGVFAAEKTKNIKSVSEEKKIDETKEAGDMDLPEETAKNYLNAFKKSIIPTPRTVDAAIYKARFSGTIDTWTEVAKISNTYANIVGILKDHYHDLYRSSNAEDSASGSRYASEKTRRYLVKVIDYEKKQNQYLKIRNDAYVELSKRYLASGDKVRALSYSAAAVKLSGVEPNTEGEDIIRRIIEYTE